MALHDMPPFVRDHYATIPFPFEESSAHAIEMSAVWNLADVEGFLHSWSSSQEFARVRGYDPVGEIHARLSSAWGPHDRGRLVRWPLYIRIGKPSHAKAIEAVQEGVGVR